MKVSKNMLVHAVAGCTAPYNEPVLVQLKVLQFKGNQHDPYNYAWDKQRLAGLREDQLERLYNKFKKDYV